MSALPAAYAWLKKLDPLPKMVTEALALLDTAERPGPGDNALIMSWVGELGGGLRRVYTADSVPWCGLFMAVVAKRAGKTPVPEPLWALNWGQFGQDAGQPGLGDVLTFIRPGGGGHVALYIGEDTTAYHVLGGNQSDKVCFTRIAKTRNRAARRPLFMKRPDTVRPFVLVAGGALSSNEA